MVETLLEAGEPRAITSPDEVHLLGRALHRMRNMMMSVRGYAELIARGEGDDVLRRRWAERIVDQLDRLESMHARLDGAQARRGDRSPQSLSMVVRAAVERSRQRFDEDLEIDLDLDGDILVEGEGEALREAVSALIDNALEAHRDAGVIDAVCVRFDPEGTDGWALHVSDRGEGLSAPVSERVGQPFFTRKAGHLGLGLYLSRTLLTRHGLSLELANDRDGGTVATIRGRKNPSGGER